MNQRTILVLGASGLIGRFVTDDLRTRGFRVVGAARSLSAAQKMSALDLELPILSLDAAALTRLFGEHAVDVITIGTSLMDMSIGVLIAFRRTAAIGLVAGIIASLGYMVGAAILTPDLWVEPLGALVKTGPAIVLMLVALLMLDNR